MFLFSALQVAHSTYMDGCLLWIVSYVVKSVAHVYISSIRGLPWFVQSFQWYIVCIAICVHTSDHMKLFLFIHFSKRAQFKVMYNIVVICISLYKAVHEWSHEVILWTLLYTLQWEGSTTQYSNWGWGIGIEIWWRYVSTKVNRQWFTCACITCSISC